MVLKKSVVIKLVFAVLATVLAVTYMTHRATATTATVESEAPAKEKEEFEQLEITFLDGNGKPKNLDVYRGKLILLNLWATWCAPCVKEMPALSDLQREFGKDGLVVVTLSADGNVDLIREFYKARNINNLPLYRDQQMKTFIQLEAKGLPVTSLLGVDGNEIERFEGYVDWTKPEIRKLITDNLPKKE